MNKKILYLTYDGLTDQLGQSQILPYLNGLSQKGFDISIISFEKKVRADSRPSIRDALNQSDISWYPLTYTKNPPVLSTVYDLLRLYMLVKRLHTSEKFNFLHCRSYLTAIVALRLKKKFGLKYLFDIRGFWIEERVEGGIWKLSNPIFAFIFKYMKLMERQLYSQADGIVSLTGKAKDIIIESFNPTSQITVIPCCVDMKLFDPSNHPKLVRSQIGLHESNLVITYLGSIGTWYMMEEMMVYFSKIVNQNPKAILLIISQENPVTILSLADQFGVKEYTRIFSATRDVVPDYIRMSDFGLFFIRPTYSKQASSPTKMAEFLSMNIPIISNSGVGDSDYFFMNYKVGVLVDLHDLEKSDSIVPDPSLFVDMSQVALDHFSLEIGISRYQTIYESL